MRNVSLKNRNLLGVREAILIVLDQIQTHCYVLYFPDHCRALMCRAANTCSKIRSLSSQRQQSGEKSFYLWIMWDYQRSSMDDWLSQNRALNMRICLVLGLVQHKTKYFTSTLPVSQNTLYFEVFDMSVTQSAYHN